MSEGERPGSEGDLPLRDLAAAYGVATEFADWQGRAAPVAAATVVAVLAALGVDAPTPAAVRRALDEHGRATWSRMLPPCVVTRQDRTRSVDVHVRHGDPVEVWIELEDGGIGPGLGQLENWTPPRDIDGRLVGQASFEVPGDLPLGYHTLRARSPHEEASTTLIVTPGRLRPPERLGARRAWGFAAQLYSVRSRGSWGVGDLADLADLAVWSAAEAGAGFVLVNPLHAAAPVVPLDPSPYLPSTRRYGNPIYLRVEAIPEFVDLDDAARARVLTLRRQVHEQLDGADRIDRDTAWTAKCAALRLVSEVPRRAGREIAYAAYRRREGPGLEDHATWCALAELHGAEWRCWPEALRDPRSPVTLAFRAEHAEAVDFHRWMQWVLDEQLAGAQAAARRAGMALGVVHDLAVGVSADGSDAWSLPDVFASGITVGAPPDAFNQHGQDWTQPPWRPDRLAAQAYAPFRDVVAAVLRHGGGVRVDHIMGLFRLWWIPVGGLPTDGTYVRYDHEALVGILALEAHRAGALVVGEDLGVVEPWVRTYLAERGILGTSILWFERDVDGAPLPPERWREDCLASVTTHDLPPTAGYLAGDHVRLRETLGLLTRPIAEELAADARERRAWLDELRRRGALSPDGPSDEEATVAALHRFLTWTPARLVAVALTDAVGDRRTQNQPGTRDEYPNWRVPLSGPDGVPLLLEDVFADRRAAALAAVVRP
ncbi:MAG: GH77 [uncultured Thermoleophilia bacterium]|uniref:4-alpha-glucanotransferase n=1 Tax=uncultured Thermoleophilia bacterium TaxID=1497501 RepID=A0A6J4U0I4_9ACTN|nr:MAG: GH77 [uncultured Thermoleophilia bacterium]